MKNIAKIFVLTACALAVVGVVRAEDSFAGKWKGQFDSQIGQQTYTYDFKVEGTNVTGRAVGVREDGTNDVSIIEGSVSTNGLCFVEPLKFNDNDIRIEYTGKLSGDEIKFHRKVGDFAEEDFSVNRVKDDDAKVKTQSATATETNSLTAKP